MLRPQPAHAPLSQVPDTSDVVPGDILFYGGSSVADRLIQWATRSRVSHCAVALGRREQVEAVRRGVVRSPIRHAQVVAVARVGHALPARGRGLAWLAAQLGRPYSEMDIASDLLGMLARNRTPLLVRTSAYDCSELCTRCLLHAGYDGLPDALADYPSRVSPADLARALGLEVGR